MTPEYKWHFPSTDNGDEDGINDSLRELFEGDHERFVARESIQNSLDARKDHSEPVNVRFERLNLPSHYIPGYTELKQIIEAAKQYSDDQDKSKVFYDEALSILNAPTVSVLKVSDYNTTGLSGDDHSTDGGWYKLIRASGVNSITGTGGGSFGIGKGAPFAASRLRVVFYSTINADGEQAFQGKARLSSFRDNSGDIRRGIGQYGVKRSSLDKGVSSIRKELEIPELFRRNAQGTDFYIIGYQTKEDDWTKLLLNSLLSNFWAAIHSDELTVELIENGQPIHVVNKGNLDELMSEFASEKNGSYNFYKAMTEPTKVMRSSLPTLGNVELYVKTGEGMPKAVQRMRKSKMVVDVINNYRVLPEPYAAVFVCTSNLGNLYLRDLEPPAHDKWDPERNKTDGKRIYKELMDWIKFSLKSMADDKDAEPEDIPDLSKYLPEAEDRDDTKPYTGAIGEHFEGKSDAETAIEIGTKQSEDALNTTATIRQRDVSLLKGYARGEDDTSIGTKNTKNKTHGSMIDNSQRGPIPRIDTSEIRFRARELRKDGSRIYQVVLTSQTDQEGSLKIMAIGDDSNYPVELGSVRGIDGTEYEHYGSMIINILLKAGETKKLHIILKHNRRYALGVE